MSVTVIADENEKSPSQERPEPDSSKAVEMGMAAQFGAMTETNRQLQAELAETKRQYDQLTVSGEGTRAEINQLRLEMNSLIAELRAEAEAEEEKEETELIPPPPAPPITDPPKKAGSRSAIHKILFG